MRLLFVVQRFGAGIAGGAETHCRAFATRLAAKGHQVEVVTSCARSYLTWANELPAGASLDDGVAVNRFAAAREREVEMFERLSSRVLLGRFHAPLHVERRWLQAQGPDLPELAGWLRTHADRFDVVIFFTYLYLPTIAGLEAIAGRVPIVLHATAHDEPPFHLTVVRSALHLVDAFAFSTPEERALVATKVAVPPTSAEIGVGVDIGPDDLAAPVLPAREAIGLGERPYLLSVGRVDAGKGAHELAAFFAEYKRRRPGPLTLVLAGDPVQPVADHPDIVQPGVVRGGIKHGLYRGCEMLVAPSFFESFSMVLTEAWAHGRVALVQGRCEVLAGQVRRARGGISYKGYAEFEVALDLLLSRPALARGLGECGRAYTASQYRWDTVLERYEQLLARVVGH